MTRLLPLPPRGRSGPWIVALSTALILAFQPMWPDRTAIAVVGAIGLTIVACTRWQLRWLPALVLILCGMALRLSVFGREASDVSDVTRAALGQMIWFGDPYGIGYGVSRPMGAPFPYGPFALLWYLPFRSDPAMLEFLVAVGLMCYFGMRAAAGRPIGLAIFAVAPPVVLASMDGSNDTSAGLLILASIAVAARWPVAGAAVLAAAVAFKPYALAWLVPLVAWAGMPVLVAFIGASVVAWSPVIFVWGIDSYAKSLLMAQSVHTRHAYWSLAAILDPVLGPAGRALETIRYALAAGVALIGARFVRSIDGVIIVGSAAFVVAQFAGYFGSYVYIAALAPVLCWRIDDWVGMGLPELLRGYRSMTRSERQARRRAEAPRQTAPAPSPTRAWSAVRAEAGEGSDRPSRTQSG
jgi:hypothetical protein